MYWFLVAFILLVWMNAASAADYYISLTGNNANSCEASKNPATPKRNFHGATGAIACLVAGDRLYIRGGNWTLTDWINGQNTPVLKSGTSWTNAITFEGYPGETAILKPGTSVTSVINIPSQHFIVIKNLTLDGSSVQFGGTCGPSGAGQCFGGVITAGSPGGGSQIRIEGNDIRNAHAALISLPHDGHVINNKLHGSLQSYAIYAGGNRAIIDGNEIYDNAAHGVQLFSSGCSTCTDDSIVRNNIFRNNGSSVRSVAALTINSGHRIQVYNNLIYNNFDGGLVVGTNTPVGEVEIYNNTVYNNGPGEALQIGGASTNLKVFNNIFSGAVSVTNSGSVNTTYGNNLCTVAGYACTIVQNPQFVNPGATPPNLQLQSSSPAKDAGTTLTSVPRDYAGPPNYTSVVRPQPQTVSGRYDIGAYEFVSGGGGALGNNDYYVALGGSDSWTCDQARNDITKPKATITSAASCVFPGDTLYIRGGTYNQHISDLSQPWRAGTGWGADQVITISGYQSEVAILRPGTQVTAVADINNKSYIIIKKLTLDAVNVASEPCIGTSTCWGAGFAAGSGGAHHVRLEDNDIKNAVAQVVSGCNDCEYVRNKIHGSQTSHGIYASRQRMLFEYNEIYDNARHGAQLYSGASGAAGSNDTNDSIFRNNLVYNNGIGFNHVGFTINSGYRIKVYNNLFYNNPNGGMTAGTNTPLHDAEVYNNTFFNNGGIGLRLAGASTGLKLYNNIFWNHTISVENLSSVSTTFGTNLCEHNQFGCTSVGDPKFVNTASLPSGLQLQATSPAKDTGTTLALVSTDYAGVTRPQPPITAGKYDLGAYEVVQSTGQTPNANPIYVAKTGTDTGRTCFDAESQSTPFLTIGKGLSCMVVAGKKLYIKAGTYAEALNNPITGGASWSAPTVISAFGTDVVIIQPASGSAVLTLNGTSTNVYRYISFEGLIFDATNTDAGIVQGPAAFVSFIRYLNGQVRNAAVGSGINGLHAGSELVGMYVHHNMTNGITFCGQGVTIRDSELAFNGSYGLQIYDPGTPGCANDTAIFRNRIHDNQSNGGVVLGGGNNVQFYNNLVYGNVGGGIKPVRYGNPTNVKIYNNTIYNNTADGIIVATDATGTELVNNILYLNPVAITDTGVGTIMTTNLCGAPGVGCEKVGDPKFENAGSGNFKLLTGSPAINVGTTKALVTTDFAGVARPQPPGPTGAYDIGAHEFVEDIPSGEANAHPIYVAKTGADSNDCFAAESQSTPKLTIASALTCMTVPGKVLNIKVGTYIEGIETKTQPITGGNGPSYTDATTIQAFGSDIVTIQLSTGGAAGIALFLNNSDHHLLFKNLIFDANNHASSNVVALMPGTHHIRFEGCEFKNTLTGFEVAFINQANNLEFVHSTFHHSATDAIFLKGPIDGFLCEYCTIHSAGDAGISWNSTGVKTNIVLRETVVNGNTAEGIDAATSTGALIQNALVYANGGIGVRMRTGANSLKFYNSSVHGNTGVGVQCDAGATGVEIKNVISYANATNIVNNCGATTATNFTTDPLFINPGAGNFRLSNGSGAINTGTPLPGLTLDLDGAIRPQGTYDIGAYERDQLTPPTQDVIALRRAFWQMEFLY